MASKEVVATGFIIFRRFQNEIHYLLLQASYQENLWTPPKGHVDPGESEMQTAVRETEEEAGLRRDQYDVLEGFQKTLRYPVRGKQKRVEYWLSELKDPETPVKISNEHRDYKWLKLEDALAYAKFPDMQEAYREAHKFIQEKA